MTKRPKTGIYPFLVTLPDRVYPFRTEIEGKWVRGKRSYDAALAAVRERLGPGHLGYRVFAYRQCCHLIGALTLIVLATIVAKDVFNNETALYAVLGLAVLAITYQEFYLHPKYYGQRWRKSVADWTVWVVPIALVLLLGVL